MQKVEALLAEAPQFTFNTNIFKAGITLADPADEIAKDEALVKDVARYLVEEQLPFLVNELKQGDSVPIDSQSLTELLHRNGVNMRYLGRMLKLIESSSSNEHKHLRHLIEREIVLRSAKHVFRQHLREQLECSQLHMSHCVAHLLNLLFAP